MAEADVDPVELGQAIQRLRERRGWSMNRLAEKAGVSQVYVKSLETGETKRPGLRVIARVARALGMSTDDLLVEAGQIPEEESAAPVDLSSYAAYLRSKGEVPNERLIGLVEDTYWRLIEINEEERRKYEEGEREGAG